MNPIAQYIKNLTPKSLIIPFSSNGGVHDLSPKKTGTFKVALGICTHRDVKLQVFNTIRRLIQCPDPEISVATAIGDALIARSRSKMGTTFLKSDCEILFFLDDDIVADTLDLTRMMWQIWKDDLDILAAPYVLKSETEKCFAVRTLEDKTEFVVGKGAEIHEVRYVSTGCMGIRKRVFQKMVEKEIVHLCHPNSKPYYPFFNEMEYRLNGTWINLSEDWAFCQRARDLGFKIYCDFSVKLGHIGTYIYDFDDLFRPAKEVKEGFNYAVDIKIE